jgi:hypothetical protein
MAVTTKNVVFWDVTPCGYSNNRRFRGTYRRHHQGDKNRQARNVSETSFLIELVFLHGMLQLLVTANAPSSPILATLMMESTRQFLQEPHGITS